ncbi:unnamed protein product, partial [Adineta ricciae]
DEQLLALKVKNLRSFLQAKNIAYHTCTEKQELVDLIVRNRHLPFTRLLIQQNQASSQPPPPPLHPTSSQQPSPSSSSTSTTNANQQQFHTTFNQFSTSTSASSSSSSSSSSTTTTGMPPPPPTPPQTPKHGNFTNFQHTMTSFASQMNHFAANLQDYVTNTVSGVLHHALGDHQQTTTATATTNNGNGTSSTFNFGTTANGPFTYSFTSPGNFIYTTTTNTTTTSPQQQRRTTTTTESTASSNTQQQATTSCRPRRKSLSELNNEQNIEDLSVRDLKEILVANFVDYKGCVEKNELVEKVRRLYRDRQNEKIKAKELDSATASDSELCKVCMDAIADCVFLDCGHMVTCVKCGKLLAECPICRSNIVRVVRVFKS